MPFNFITIEGNIGSGKTSFAQKLAHDFNGRLCLEKFTTNPFLSKFYDNPRQYAFPLELFFMAERYQQMKTLVSEGDLFRDFIISDYLFVKSLLFANVNLDSDESLLYLKLFDIIYPHILQPQMIVYLHNDVSNLLLNIVKRGRSYEKSIGAAYLEKIQSAYFQYFKSITKQVVLVVNVSKMDFVENREDYKKLQGLINSEYSAGMHFINP